MILVKVLEMYRHVLVSGLEKIVDFGGGLSVALAYSPPLFQRLSITETSSQELSLHPFT